ncbi:hypothetical protein [Deinococcus sp. SL84]|uniref:hypothetical protein n=1 Tax=Deinococcus sp. SL84 TaxID=2994663 RepID=UPI0022770802|nr:hypothetical protein [Deinococcus sp. SL84]MCY1703636.1 hypothetical protein [Deinococcus sp. SL84]
MNLLQALSALPELTAPLGGVYDSVPLSPPRGPYAVVSDISDVVTRQGFDHQDRQSTVLVTIYGAEQGTLGSLRPLWRSVRELGSAITSHPGLPPIGGCLLGPVLPPTFDPVTKRPYAGVRFLITYRSVTT